MCHVISKVIMTTATYTDQENKTGLQQQLEMDHVLN